MGEESFCLHRESCSRQPTAQPYTYRLTHPGPCYSAAHSPAPYPWHTPVHVTAQSTAQHCTHWHTPVAVTAHPTAHNPALYPLTHPGPCYSAAHSPALYPLTHYTYFSKCSPLTLPVRCLPLQCTWHQHPLIWKAILSHAVRECQLEVCLSFIWMT
jgi:hypothetical protein